MSWSAKPVGAEDPFPKSRGKLSSPTLAFLVPSHDDYPSRLWGTVTTGIRPVTMKKFWPKSGGRLAIVDGGPFPPSRQLRRYANCEGLWVLPFLGHWLAVRLQV